MHIFHNAPKFPPGTTPASQDLRRAREQLELERRQLEKQRALPVAPTANVSAATWQQFLELRETGKQERDILHTTQYTYIIIYIYIIYICLMPHAYTYTYTYNYNIIIYIYYVPIMCIKYLCVFCVRDYAFI